MKDPIDQYIDRVKHLPPAPTVAVQLLGLFADPDRDIDRIVELVSHDPALTAETLKRCNSASLVGAEPATDMFEAVSRLGFYEVYSIVMALVASRTMFAVRTKYPKEGTRLWQHTVTTAAIAAILARRVEVVEAKAFTAGLLHDVGKLVFVSVEGTTYAEMARREGGFGRALAAAEEAAYGFTHASLGARLLARWGLPESVCLAVKLHHQSPVAAGQFQRLAAAIHFANGLAHQMIDGPTCAEVEADLSPEAMALVELTPAEIPAVIQQVRQALEKMQGLLQMQP